MEPAQDARDPQHKLQLPEEARHECDALVEQLNHARDLEQWDREFGGLGECDPAETFNRAEQPDPEPVAHHQPEAPHRNGPRK